MATDIVLLHGFTHTGASWRPVIEHLDERYTAHAPDIRGHGSAAEARPVDLQHVLGDIAALPVERFALVGYSMGGRIALHAALAIPGVTRLVLIGASPGIEDAAERTRRRAADDALADEIEGMGIERFARRWATSTPVLDDQPASVVERVHEDRLRNSPAGLAGALRGLGTGVLPSLWDHLPRLRIPVRLVVGERDHKFRAMAEAMATRLPEAEMRLVPGTGHAVHLEAPHTAAEIIARG